MNSFAGQDVLVAFAAGGTAMVRVASGRTVVVVERRVRF